MTSSRTSSRWIAVLVVICGLAVSCGSVASDGEGADESTTAPEPTTAPQPTTDTETPLVEPTPPPLAITCAEQPGQVAVETSDFEEPGDKTNTLKDAEESFANQVQGDPDDVEQISSDSGQAVYHYSVDGVVLAIGDLDNLGSDDAPYWAVSRIQYCPTADDIAQSER